MQALVDNDALVKLACYRWLTELPDITGSPIGLLGSARYVVRSLLAKRSNVIDRPGALAAWQAFLDDAEEIEPDDQELNLATALEEIALLDNLPFDGGEGLLCA
ncbi:MAG: hypothetical protein JWR83_2320, partial [Aeromicrobium sp.]|nr:hypothetical protein [Aeromicrobium sp.]